MLIEGARGRKMERVKGIEPSPKAWEAFVLPLNYTRDLCEARRLYNRHRAPGKRPAIALRRLRLAFATVSMAAAARFMSPKTLIRPCPIPL